LTNNPLISVIIPGRNESQYIGEAIESIRKQTYQNIEIIVIDDHSTDNTKDIVQSLMLKDSRISYYLSEDRDKKKTNWRGYDIDGGYSGRKFGFTKAKGELITFEDADDASYLNRIEIEFNLLKKYNATLVTTQWQQLKTDRLNKQFDIDNFLKDNDEDDIVIRPETLYKMSQESKGILMKNWFPHNITPFPIKWFKLTRPLFFSKTYPYPGVGSSALFRREILEKVNFRKRDDRIWPATSGRGQDRDFLFQVAETFKNSYSFKIPLYLWRVRSEPEEFQMFDKYII
jgi:glycosyltransferase involved in cell wall biosynthesis